METYTKRSTTPEVSDAHSIAELLRELREETVTLAKQEVALAKAEMKEKAGKIARNTVYLAVGGLVAYAGILFLLVCAMRALTLGLFYAGMAPVTAAWLSPLILGAVVFLIGAAMASKGLKAIKREPLVPEKTIQSIKEETSWTRAKIKEA